MRLVQKNFFLSVPFEDKLRPVSPWIQSQKLKPYKKSYSIEAEILFSKISNRFVNDVATLKAKYQATQTDSQGQPASTLDQKKAET